MTVNSKSCDILVLLGEECCEICMKSFFNELINVTTK